MLDINFIKANKEQIKTTVKNKKIKIDIDRLLALDEERRGVRKQIDDLREKRNSLAKAAKGAKPTADQIEEGKALKDEISALETGFGKLEADFSNLMLQVPNVYAADTPVGESEADNKIIKQYGEPTKFTFEPKDHMALGEALGIIDTEKSARISGARFNYLFGEAVLLQFAIIQFVLDTLTNGQVIKTLANQTDNPFDKPFLPVVPPVMAKSEIMKKMDRFDPIEDRYFFEQDDALLIGSAEHTLGPLHLDEIIPEKDLPIRYVGYSTAFRREAGTYGKDAAGILRRHQFDKAEMETFIQPQYGRKEQDLIIAIQEYLVQKLEIPYQLVLKCTADMGKPDFRAVDVECWMPGQDKYRETHTSDYMTDYQARRLNIRYKDAKGDKAFVHMNDATAFAIGRILIAILENYQEEDGSIKIPKILQQYIPGNLKIIKMKK